MWFMLLCKKIEMDHDIFIIGSERREFKKFLEKRGISEDIITYILSENIDADAIVKMNEKDLSEIFPKYGDRIAVHDFCRRKLLVPSKKKFGLIDKLRLKLNKIDGQNIDIDQAKENINTIYKPKKRKIEIGWLDFDYILSKYVQVRSKKGGGTRNIYVEDSICKDGLLAKAKELFFPNGISPKGKIDEYIYNITDFKESILIDNVSIDVIFKTTGLTRLRFYLTTNCKKYNLIPSTATSGLYEQQLEHITGFNEVFSSHSHDDAVYSKMFDGNDESEEANDNYLQIDESHSPFPPYLPSNNTNQDERNNMLADNLQIDDSVTELRVHRGHVFDELIVAMLEIPLNCKPLKFCMLLPNGKEELAFDNGGVYRDVLSEFWDQFYEKCTEGSVFKIPCLRHDFGAKEWYSVAKIIYKGWTEQKYLPIKLCPSFMEYCLTGKLIVNSNIIDYYLDFIAPSDSEILKKALNDFESVNKEELIEVFDNLGSKWLPTKDNVKQLINDIAHKDIIQKPMFITKCFMEHLKDLLSVEELNEQYAKMAPTSKNIISILNFKDNLDCQMITVVGYLKKYIKEVDIKHRSLFLRFCTGADIIISSYINVSFNNTKGLSRTPVGHTCGCELMLSYNYENYPDFRSEFNSLLNSNVWVMDIV